jgi:glycosyltransferase involved in cell wall biosynthesis
VVTTNHGPFDGELGDLYREIAATVPVIAISEHHASTAAAGGIPVAAVIHHGVDVSSFPLGAGVGGYAMFLGRMNPDKGVDAAARVARRAGVPLRIAGKMREPAERAYFDASVAPLLADGLVEYVGEVGGVQKLELLGGASCLLNPIAWPEPFGMVMIEALACGTPVLATPWGSAPEIVTDGVTGYVACEDGLVDAIGRVDQLDRARCRAQASARFSIGRMVADHVDLYRRISTRTTGSVGSRLAS